MKAVIQAGGMGSRLRPYTRVLPKPLMPVGGEPVLEILLKWLRRNSFTDVIINIGYLGKLIRSFCGDGSQWDMNIKYSEESEPLGTIGPLHLIREELQDTFLVLNGDLLTDLDLYSFIKFHKSYSNILTIGATEKKVKMELGLIECHENKVVNFIEKPVNSYRVSMGIYCMEPDIFDYIPHDTPFGFDDLMYRMLEEKLEINAYHHEGIWMDIGREEDFKKAQEAFNQNCMNTISYEKM